MLNTHRCKGRNWITYFNCHWICNPLMEKQPNSKVVVKDHLLVNCGPFSHFLPFQRHTMYGYKYNMSYLSLFLQFRLGLVLMAKHVISVLISKSNFKPGSCFLRMRYEFKRHSPVFAANISQVLSTFQRIIHCEFVTSTFILQLHSQV